MRSKRYEARSVVVVRSLCMRVQAAYAGDLLYILSLTFSKISLLMLLRLLTPVRKQINAISSLGTAIFLWSLASLLSAAFQCHTPRVWAFIGNQCFQKVSSKSWFYRHPWISYWSPARWRFGIPSESSMSSPKAYLSCCQSSLCGTCRCRCSANCW